MAGLAVWEAVGRLWAIRFLPPCSAVLEAAVRMVRSGEIGASLLHSLGNLALGFSLAVSVGIPAGIALGRSRAAADAFGPVLIAMLASPKLLFLPLLYAVFGVSRDAQVAIIFLSAVFVIAAHAQSGVRTVDQRMVEMARAFCASPRQLFWKVVLPGSLPLALAGVRLGMGRAVAGMISGEMFITVYGLGATLRLHGDRFDSTGVFAVLLVVAAVAVGCTGAVGAVERRLMRWTGPVG